MEKELKSIIETLIIENSLTLVKVNVLTKIVLGVYNDTLPPGQAQAIENKFKSVLKSESEATLNELKEIVSDHKKILKHLYNLHEANL